MSNKGTSGNVLLYFVVILAFIASVAFFVFLAFGGYKVVSEEFPSTFVRVTWELGQGSSKTMKVQNNTTKTLKMRLDYVEKGIIWDSHKTVDLTVSPSNSTRIAKDFKKGEQYSLFISGDSTPIRGTVP